MTIVRNNAYMLCSQGPIDSDEK